MSAPRYLTKAEIDEILHDVLPIQNNHMFIQKDAFAKRKMIEGIRGQMKAQLRQTKISPDAIPQLKEEMLSKLYRSLAQPGTQIGLIVAESFGQEVTQSVLNSKRMTGAGKDFSGGLAAMESLLTGSKGAIFPAHISFTNPYYTAFDVYRFAARFTYTTLKNISQFKTSELIPMNEYEPEWWIDVYKQIHGEIPFDSQHVIRVVLNMDKVYEHQITMKSVLEAIENSSEGGYLYPVPSPLTIPEPYIDVFVNSIALEDLVRTQTQGNSAGSVEVYHFNTFDSQDICIKGIPHVLQIRPNFVETRSSVQFSQKLDFHGNKKAEKAFLKAGGTKDMLKNLWFVQLNEEYMETYGIPKEKVIKLLEACHMEIIPHEGLFENLDDDSGVDMEEIDEDYVLLVRTDGSMGDKKPESILLEMIDEANKKQDDDFKEAIQQRSNMVPNLNELYKLGKHFFAMIRMEKEKDKKYFVLAPFSRYKIVDISRSYAGDIYENLNFLGVIGLKNFLKMKIKGLIEGAGGTAVDMHISIMVKYQVRMGNYTRFNLKGVEEEAGGFSSATLWRDPMRHTMRAAAQGSLAARRTWANVKFTNAEMPVGSHISGVRTDVETETKYKKELETQRQVLKWAEEGKSMKEIEELMKEQKEEEKEYEDITTKLFSSGKKEKEVEVEVKVPKRGKAKKSVKIQTPNEEKTMVEKSKPAVKRAARKPKASTKPKKTTAKSGGVVDIDDL